MPKNVEKTGFLGFPTLIQETLRKFAVLPRLGSKLQGRRPSDCKMWANNKIEHFSSKKFKFRAKKRRKSGFFGVLRLYFRKTLLKFAVLLRSSSDLQGSRLLKRKRCPINKKDHFRSKKSFGPKNFEKTGFLGFSDISSGKRLANLLLCSD